MNGYYYYPFLTAFPSPFLSINFYITHIIYITLLSQENKYKKKTLCLKDI